MKKLLLSIIIFNTFVTHLNAQESEDEIQLDEVDNESHEMLTFEMIWL